MGSRWGVQVQHHGECYLLTSSARGEEHIRNIGIVIAQLEARLARRRKLLRKMVEATEEMRRREAAGKARRAPAEVRGAAKAKAKAEAPKPETFDLGDRAGKQWWEP